jgi:hypothetical protein
LFCSRGSEKKSIKPKRAITTINSIKVKPPACPFRVDGWLGLGSEIVVIAFEIMTSYPPKGGRQIDRGGGR